MLSKKYFFPLLMLALFFFIYKSFNKESRTESPEVSSISSPKTSPVPESKLIKEKDSTLAIPITKNDITQTPLKKTKIEVQNYKNFKLKDSPYQIALDYSVCSANQCEENVEVIQYSKFRSIQKVPISRFIDESTPDLVMIDTNNRSRLGIWNKNVVIQVKNNAQIESSLKDLGFQNIQNPLNQIYIASYNGDISQIDDIIKKVSSINNVINVQLELKFQQRR